MELLQYLDNETKNEIKEAYQEDRFKWLGDYGFLTWLELVRNGRLWIYLNNLYILPEYKNKINLFSLRKFFREKYPNAIFYFHRDKKDKFYYHK